MPKTAQKQASFSKVAECLYRNQSSGTYYALVKRSGSQIRRSLKTKDRKLAERRLKDFREQADRLSSNGKDKRLSFKSLAERWEPIATASLSENIITVRILFGRGVGPFCPLGCEGCG